MIFTLKKKNSAVAVEKVVEICLRLNDLVQKKKNAIFFPDKIFYKV